MRALADAGFKVTGIGRSRASALGSDPSADWVIRDIPAIEVDDWRRLLSGVDVVVNASGALQDGARDDLEAIHVTAMARLVAAADALPLRIVQISAAGVSAAASTEFFRSKARGDTILAAGAANWVILRPTLVLSPEAYGGTALLRAVAALPLLLPKVLPEAQIQTVHVADVAAAVVAAARGEVPSGTIADLTERDVRSFLDLTLRVRRWQGYPPPVLTPALPQAVLSISGRVADLLGQLGWRSPLRTTALRALRDGIRGDPAPWDAVGGRLCKPLDETLALMPATRQERLFARVYLALPLAIGTLALFWCLSGLIALVDPGRAMAVLAGSSAPAWASAGMVVGGALADIFLGLAILWRPWTKRAALGMIGLSCAYLGGSFLTAPGLWADPLGPMLKVFPGMMLAAMVWLLMEDR
jgi:uncharacterized protein YbjT (DUF2867 family)